jgi:Bacterial SH3 domain
MIRQIAAISISMAAWLSPAWVSAQPLILTVTAASADVYSSPSTGSPVIGHVLRGTRLEVTRELGSWVKVWWPSATDGVGYVHMSMGTLGRGAAPEPPRPVPVAVRPGPEPTQPAPVAIRAPRPPEPTPPARLVYVTPPTHIVGLGGLIGTSTLGYGATARAWSRDRLGVQLAASRYAPSSVVPSRVTSMQFEPSLLYAPANYVGDYLWARPYVGSGVSVRRQTLSGLTPGSAPLLSENNVGVQVFGGSEFTFAGVPRFALSADVGYRWPRTSFAGVDFGGPSLSVSGHWYVK